MTVEAIRERQREFVQAFREHLVAKTAWPGRPREAWSVTNGATVVEGGIQVGVINLEHADLNKDGFAVCAMLRLPPNDEVYFGIVVENDLATIDARLKELAKEGRNNNVRVYLAQDGRLYCVRAGYLDSLDGEAAALGMPITIDRIVVALYPPLASAGRSVRLRDLLALFTNAVGRGALDELALWEAGSEAVSPMPTAISLDELRGRIERLGGFYKPELVESYDASINYLVDKHFVVLKGVSGTGKTLLAKLYAFAVHGYTDMRRAEAEDALFFMCSVRPDWTSPLGLLGYLDVISGKYQVTPFVRALLVALAHSTSPVFVCLDEMNIAQTEYYLADVLSAIESRMPIELHRAVVPIEGSGGEKVPGSINLPPNLFITGTINSDETTRPLSDKVLDRVQLIDISAVDLVEFFNKLKTADPTVAVAVDTFGQTLADMHHRLAENDLGFGYRLAEEVIRFVTFADTRGAGDMAQAFDTQLVQKVLAKLRGAERQRKMLSDLKGLLKPYGSAVSLLSRLQAELDEFGSFQVTR